jgi:predicted NBD/HSP70 family sugar kinase
MPVLLGMDLGGTKLDFLLAAEDGTFLYEKQYDSPFQKTGKTLAGGDSEVMLDTMLTHIPEEQRVAAYLNQTEDRFLQEAQKEIGSFDIAGKGASLCGRTREQDGNIVIAGGNTPMRFASGRDQEKPGIVVMKAKADYPVTAANDGTAAATAQGIYYKVFHGIDPEKTAYFILGTGFGCGIPHCDVPAEIGHIPVGFMPEALWQTCGCTTGHPTACAENYASGRGIANCARILLSLRDSPVLKTISPCLVRQTGFSGLSDFSSLSDLAAVSRISRHPQIDAKIVMDYAENHTDDLAVFIADLAAQVTADAAIAVAHLFGLTRIGIGESVARSNPWHVNNIAKKAADRTRNSTLLVPPLTVELTPINNPAKYGALSLVVPESQYEAWAGKMAPSPGRDLPAAPQRGQS